jgi:hypothetical protein
MAELRFLYEHTYPSAPTAAIHLATAGSFTQRYLPIFSLRIGEYREEDTRAELLLPLVEVEVEAATSGAAEFNITSLQFNLSSICTNATVGFDLTDLVACSEPPPLSLLLSPPPPW